MKTAAPCLAARVLLRVLPNRYQYRMSQTPAHKLVPKIIGRASMLDCLLMALMFGAMSALLRPVLVRATSLSDLLWMVPIIIGGMVVFACLCWALGLTPRSSLDCRIEDEMGGGNMSSDMRYKANRLSCDLLDAWIGGQARAQVSGDFLEESTQQAADLPASQRRL